MRTTLSHDSLRTTPRAACALLACAALLGGCKDEPSPVRVPGGDAQQGLRLVTQYQCAACHVIPGVQGGADGADNAGPALEHIGRLSYIAGGIPNQPANMVQWLRVPHAVKPGTEMPPMGLTEQEARHIAAFLYTLR